MTSEGEILEFLRYAPEILKGKLDKNATPPIALGPYVKPEEQPLSVYASSSNTTTVGDITMGDIDVMDSKDAMEEKEMKDSKINQKRNIPNSTKANNIEKETVEMTTKVIRKKAESDEMVDVMDKDVVKEVIKADIKFQGFSARLTPEIILQIEDINKAYKKNPKNSIHITSFVTEGDDTNTKLAKNRIDACKDLLVTYGVPEDQISSQIKPYSSVNKGNVSIELIDSMTNN